MFLFVLTYLLNSMLISLLVTTIDVNIYGWKTILS